MTIRSGATRTVFVFDRFVVKVPVLHAGWRGFLKGLLANMSELTVWRTVNNPSNCKHKDRNKLCPVLFGWAGFVLIQPNCNRGNWDGQHVAMPLWVDDVNEANRGEYKGRTVIFDYAQAFDEKGRRY